VHRVVAVGAAYAWRLLAIGLAVAAVVWLTGQLLVVVVPLAVAALLARALSPVSSRLRRRGLKPALAAILTLLGFLVVVAAAVGFVGWAVAGEVDELGPTISAGVDDVTDWLVQDSPFDVSRDDVARWREQAGDALSAFVRSSGGSALSGAVLAGEIVVGMLLAVIVTFFLLKDGRHFVERAVGTVPADRRPDARRVLDRAWEAAGGYLRGAALLGVVESVIIGLTSLLVGADLVAAVMLLTFLAAFVPIVGAIVAGIVAVLVALVTAGTVPALIVGAVAIVVQQLDNDLLAPVIYGRAVRLHPLVVLLGIAAGGALFGIVGTVFAVPVLAVTLNAFAEARRHDDAGDTTARPAVDLASWHGSS
jgi:predicted PurR-regulated permease PerM